MTFVAPEFAGSCTVTATSVRDSRRAASTTVDVVARPSGAVVWSATFGSMAEERVSDVSVDDGGNVFLAGTTTGEVRAGVYNPGGTDAFVAKYGSDGVTQWIWQLGTREDDRVFLVEPQADGGAIVGGATAGSFTYPATQEGNLFLAKFDVATQATEWVLEFGTVEMAQIATAMARDVQGNIFVAGEGYDITLVKYASDGSRIWSGAYGELYLNSAEAMVVDDDGNAVFTGPSYKDHYVAKVSADGGSWWWATDVGFYGYYDIGTDVDVETSGNIVCTGSSSNPGPPLDQGWLSKLDPDGTELWVRDVGPSDDTGAWAVAIAPDGGIVVGGWTAGRFDLGEPDGRAFATKYDAAGVRLWTRQFGPADRSPVLGMAAEVDASGRSVVAAAVPRLIDDRPDPDGSGLDVLLTVLSP